MQPGGMGSQLGNMQQAVQTAVNSVGPSSGQQQNPMQGGAPSITPGTGGYAGNATKPLGVPGGGYMNPGDSVGTSLPEPYTPANPAFGGVGGMGGILNNPSSGGGKYGGGSVGGQNQQSGNSTMTPGGKVPGTNESYDLSPNNVNDQYGFENTWDNPVRGQNPGGQTQRTSGYRTPPASYRPGVPPTSGYQPVTKKPIGQGLPKKGL